jgi:hypothetical protein
VKFKVISKNIASFKIQNWFLAKYSSYRRSEAVGIEHKRRLPGAAEAAGIEPKRCWLLRSSPGWGRLNWAQKKLAGRGWGCWNQAKKMLAATFIAGLRPLESATKEAGWERWGYWNRAKKMLAATFIAGLRLLESSTKEAGRARWGCWNRAKKMLAATFIAGLRPLESSTKKLAAAFIAGRCWGCWQPRDRGQNYELRLKMRLSPLKRSWKLHANAKISEINPKIIL